MENSGYILYVLLAAILWLMWRNAPGLSLLRLLKHDEDIHHKAHHAIARHPHGARWKAFKKTYDAET